MGYTGNEHADKLAKEAAASQTQPLDIPFSKCHFKNTLKKHMLEEWQNLWEHGDTGRIVYDITPKVSFKPLNWNRAETLFFTGHGPFQAYLKRFKLASMANCSCGLEGTPIHYATECPLTESYHMKKPAPENLKTRYKSVAKTKGSREKIQKIITHLNTYPDLFTPPQE